MSRATHTSVAGAGPPQGLCWDQRSCKGGEPIIDDSAGGRGRCILSHAALYLSSVILRAKYTGL